MPPESRGPSCFGIIVVVAVVAITFSQFFPPKPPPAPDPMVDIRAAQERTKHIWVEQTPADCEGVQALLTSRVWTTTLWDVTGNASDNSVNWTRTPQAVRFTPTGRIIKAPGGDQLGTYRVTPYRRFPAGNLNEDERHLPPAGRDFGQRAALELNRRNARRAVMNVVGEERGPRLLQGYSAIHHTMGDLMPVVFRNGDTLRVELHNFDSDRRWDADATLHAASQGKTDGAMAVFTGDDP